MARHHSLCTQKRPYLMRHRAGKLNILMLHMSGGQSNLLVCNRHPSCISTCIATLIPLRLLTTSVALCYPRTLADHVPFCHALVIFVCSQHAFLDACGVLGCSLRKQNKEPCIRPTLERSGFHPGLEGSLSCKRATAASVTLKPKLG